MILMFIGGNPGSTAGGVKTVTIAVLAISAYNGLKDSHGARVFHKVIPYQTVLRALLIVLLGMSIIFVAFFFLSMTQNIDSVSLLFETFSALGTVGLSTGATAKLDEIGKTIILLCMLAGRVGPLTFILLLMKKQTKKKWDVPVEDVSIT
jgi:trk system potassium uptake protein TrkH